MDPLFAQELCELNNRFYCTWADSFSDTRHNTWPGWNRCLKESGLTDRIYLMLPAEIFALKDTLPALSLMPSSKSKHLMPVTNWPKTAFSFP